MGLSSGTRRPAHRPFRTAVAQRSRKGSGGGPSPPLGPARESQWIEAGGLRRDSGREGREAGRAATEAAGRRPGGRIGAWPCTFDSKQAPGARTEAAAEPRTRRGARRAVAQSPMDARSVGPLGRLCTVVFLGGSIPRVPVPHWLSVLMWVRTMGPTLHHPTRTRVSSATTPSPGTIARSGLMSSSHTSGWLITSWLTRSSTSLTAAPSAGGRSR